MAVPGEAISEGGTGEAAAFMGAQLLGRAGERRALAIAERLGLGGGVGWAGMAAGRLAWP